MMYKRCCRCGVRITADKKMCDKCLEKSKRRYIEYNTKKRNPKHGQFYVSNAWKLCRRKVMAMYSSIDVYEFVINKKIVHAEEVHHIEPLEDVWSRRLDVTNLIPLSHKTHMLIEALYRRDERTKRRTQEQLRKVLDEFKSGGGIV